LILVSLLKWLMVPTRYQIGEQLLIGCVEPKTGGGGGGGTKQKRGDATGGSDVCGGVQN